MKLVSTIARAGASALWWTGARGRDAALWPVNLVRDLPVRVDRLGATVIQAASGVRRAVPETLQVLKARDPALRSAWLRQTAAGSAVWLLSLGTRFFDLAGGPELGQLLIHLGSHVEPLSPEES